MHHCIDRQSQVHLSLSLSCTIITILKTSNADVVRRSPLSVLFSPVPLSRLQNNSFDSPKPIIQIQKKRISLVVLFF